MPGSDNLKFEEENNNHKTKPLAVLQLDTSNHSLDSPIEGNIMSTTPNAE